MGRHAVHDGAPAARWEDAFLSGNGEVGIMVFGDPHAERVVFNHHRFVLPNGSLALRPPKVADRLDRVRDLILAGEAAAAQRAFSDGRELAWTQPFHPGYVMCLDSPSAGPVRDYRRVTDFTTGEVTVGWSDARGEWRRRAFVSRADRVVVQELAGPGLALTIRLSGDLPDRPPSVRYGSDATLDPDGRVRLTIRGSYASGGSGFGGTTLVVATGGSVTVDGDAAVVQHADRVLLLSALDRSSDPPVPDVPGGYDTLLARHTAIHRPIYERVELDLVDQPQLERLFHAGRYLLLSSCGVLPPRLTGLWLGAWGAAWSGDFTTDANLNLHLASANLAAFPEAMEAYTALLRGQIDHWRTNARDIYGVRGVLAPSRTDGESGYLFHLDDEWPWPMWTAGADWLLFPMVEHWQVTGDERFLAEELAPWLVETAQFYEDFLTRTDADGRVVFVPSYSPETGPAGADGVAAVNATMDLAAGRHALTTAIDVCRHLRIEAEAVTRWRALLDRLPPYRVDERGALTEWAWPGLISDEDHRHVSHLYPVWPLHDITPDGTPELAAAARRALELRGDENLSAHGSLHRALAAARLKDADLAYTNLGKILENNMVYRSLMTAHYPDLDTYNADAALALPAVLIEMLVDTRPGVVELLPALPEQFPRGSIRGLTGRGRVTVDELVWDLPAGTVRAVLRSPVDQRVTLICRRAVGDRPDGVELPAGKAVPVSYTIR